MSEPTCSLAVMMERLREDSQIPTVVHRRVGRPVVHEQLARQAEAGEEDQSVPDVDGA